MTDLIVNNKKFEIIDTLEYITLADSFLKNKIGSGHGEAKLYVGNVSERLLNFFGNFSGEFFFCRKDFKLFLSDAKSEYLSPQQEYVKKSNMGAIFNGVTSELNEFDEEILKFDLYRVDVEPPRVYVNSVSKYYNFMRAVGLPNISYLSVLKLKDENYKLFYYLRIFIDYKSDFVSYVMKDEEEQENQIADDISISQKVKDNLISARIGQGDYRKKLLGECPFCPFTMINDERLLIASHIKPWVKSDDKEKIDPKNGFMLTPTYDRLFDRGFITFNNDKTIVVSPWISPMNQKRLGIFTGKEMKMLPLDEKRIKYLQYHREYIFKY